MPARRAITLSFLVAAACTPRARAPRGPIEHPLGVSTAPGPATPPPLATNRASAVQPVTSGLITGAPAAQVPTMPSSSAAVAPPTSPPAAPVAAVAPAAPVPAPTQYTGGTSSTVVQEPNARIPSTPSGVASETTAGTPSGATPASSPSTPSGVPDTTGQPASPVPSGTPDQPATGVLAPPPPSEP